MKLAPVVALVVALTACSHDYHVALAPLPPSPSPEQRVQTFEHYRSTGEHEDVSHSCGSHGCSKQTRPVLALASGDEIRYAEDLAPLVHPDTDTGTALAHIERAKSRRTRWALVGWTGLIAGVVVATVGLARESVPLQIAGAGIGLAVGGAGTLGVFWNDARIRRETLRAFSTYDASLARSLDVCVDGLSVVACTH